MKRFIPVEQSAILIPGKVGSGRGVLQRQLVFEHAKRVEAGMEEEASARILKARVRETFAS